MSRTGNTLVAILAGAAVGAVAGILLAPERGSDTRKKISKGFKEGKDEVACKIEELKNQLVGLISSKKENIEDTIESFVADSGDKADEVINKLEDKIARLKAKVEKQA
ncbi:YtxH domain-containing protein [Capnocytophaga sp. ARDL2]|uniref:YtxH domain-containing protein n=1 Tax=Capnocytophaga sp. ARDL2 TaxID=3238809 RepID=UPI003557C519